MIRQNLLVLGLAFGCLTGCQINSQCRSHSFRPPGMYGTDCGSCGSSCGVQCRNQHQGNCRTAALFPGDSYGQAAEYGCVVSTCGSYGTCDGGSPNLSAGCGCQSGVETIVDSGCSAPTGFSGARTSTGCSQCGGSPFAHGNLIASPVPVPSGVSPSCGCGQQPAAQQYSPYSPQPLAPPTVRPQTLVPSTPGEFKAPSTSESTYDSDTAGRPVQEGQVPVPPSDDPTPMPEEPKVFEADPPLPLNVDQAAEGVPSSATLVDPVSWEIPVL